MVESLTSKPLGLSEVAGPCTRSRARRQSDAEHKPSQPQPQHQAGGPCILGLHVRWTEEDGASRAVRLPLAFISCVSELRGLFRRLLLGASSPEDDDETTTTTAALPDYLTSPEYYKFTPAEDYVSLPGDAIRTQFRLVATIDGWEVTVAERELGGPADPERRLVVTVAEFESEPVDLPDGRQMVVSFLSFPTVCVQRAFLDDTLAQLASAVASPAQSSGGGGSQGSSLDFDE